MLWHRGDMRLGTELDNPRSFQRIDNICNIGVYLDMTEKDSK